MKTNFKSLPENVQDTWNPAFYMIMGLHTSSDLGVPQTWHPPYFSEENNKQCRGRLYDADGNDEPELFDPLEVYTKEVAMQHIAENVLSIGLLHVEGFNQQEPTHYRLVPVYTGLEHFLGPKVMIFSVQNGSVTPCKEWPEDPEDKDWTPLCHMFGFHEVEVDDQDYAERATVPIFSKDHAEKLISLQYEADKRLGEDDTQYITIPVSFPDPHSPLPQTKPAPKTHKPIMVV